MARNQFVDPAGVRPTYNWNINHSEEGAGGKARSVQATPNTGGTGYVIQQNPSGPELVRVNGTIMRKDQLDEMVQWYKLCDTQTIYFYDFAGEQREVLITSFTPTRHRTVRNSKDYGNAPLWFWRYELEMMTVRVISGPWAGVV